MNQLFKIGFGGVVADAKATVDGVVAGELVATGLRNSVEVASHRHNRRS